MTEFHAAALLKDFVARFELLLSTGDLDANVPGCPGWDLAALGCHVGGIYRFAATAVEERRESEVLAGPSDGAALGTWFTESASSLFRAFSQHDEHEPCWTMAPPRNVAFWTRRMAHETALHLWDGETSQGSATPIDPVVAIDGIREVATMFFPRQVRLGRIGPLSDGVRFEVADASGEAVVLSGDGTGAPNGAVDATLFGPAEAILLLLWKRRSIDEAAVRISGDEGAVRRVLAAALTP